MNILYVLYIYYIHILYMISSIHYIYYMYRIYTILYMQNYIVEEVKNYSMNLLKNSHAVNTSFALRAIFRLQLILYKTL